MNDTGSGSCQSGQWIRGENPGASDAENTVLCSGGAFPELPFTQPDVKDVNSDDDLGGGATVLSIPDVVHTTPLDGESMPPRFKVYADAGDGGDDAIAMAISVRGGGPIRFQADNVNVASGVQACNNPNTPCAPTDPGLDEGRYDISWALTSEHVGDTGVFDTSVLDTRFVVQESMVGSTGSTGPIGPIGPTGPGGSTGAGGPTGPTGATGAQGGAGPQGIKGDTGEKGIQGDKGDKGDTGSAGPQGPAGATGPRGPAGRDAKVTCKVKKGKKRKVTCTVRFTTPRNARVVRARISRRGRTYAVGRGVARRGHVALRLRARRAVPRGRYTLTVVTVDRSGRSVTTRSRVHVR